MADIASGSSRYNPYIAWSELPDPLSRVAVPSAVVTPWSPNALTRLWDPPTARPSDVQLNVLAWLAYHSTAEGKAAFEGREHLTFAHRQHAQNCILLTDPGSECISVRVGRYSVITLGTRAGEDAGDKRILMDAHRLVCCLTSGPPPEPGAVARHAKHCRAKGCINPAHLSWGTQKANVKEDAGARATAADLQAGAVGLLVLWGLAPGRCRAIFRAFATRWCGSRRLWHAVLLARPRIILWTTIDGPSPA